MRAPQRCVDDPYSARLMLSAPPPIVQSASPSRMYCAADTIACSPLPHRRLTVIAPVSCGRPPFTAHTREMYMSLGSVWITLPITTWLDVGRVHLRSRDGLAYDFGAEIARGEVLEASAVIADGGANARQDDDFSLAHGISSKLSVNSICGGVNATAVSS